MKISNPQKRKRMQKERRRRRVRAKIVGTHDRPRLSFYRSIRSIYVQLIDDGKGVTLCGFSQKVVDQTGTKTEQAARLGERVGKAIQEQGITKVVFDRGGNAYHGRIQAFAEAVRTTGVLF